MLVSPSESERLRSAFEEFIRAKEFPCVGAKSALSRGTLKTLVGWSIESAWDDLRLHDELMIWSNAYRSEPGLFRSLAVIFAQSGPLDEAAFEQALWDRLQSLADKDAWLGLPYDERVSADPINPHFSLSFGGEAFFAVGLHPAASRPARRFERPVIVFNLHDQFELLRQEGRYETIRETILERDERLAGSVNPMLARHGEASEAAQYSGREVSADWKCPFHDPRAAA
ncbi:guanitoxin biosynthesis heme-dependent pre-guanitoxin N-hydroxylase GntA [Sphingobium nicotianae]|uniref:YqcI/YcgG family protein n=1 Tax=Sphingobium nicotianae TaxID=2782607 RepID=A0A9X1DBE2_9SPHN|nr:guanitoxin biosynthesis heme-dependent pre-guanitoxin N-hydroxylase GntA [Sphingobium nicotianae]MBT2186785.1 YqcI/YcgG family protein [Sphingobium nicotianae]